MHSIKIISDVSCPWCVIGYKSLQAAIDELGMAAVTDISWKPFELNSTMPREGQNRAEYIQRKYGLNPQQAKANRQQLVDRGLEVGYEFNFPEDGRVYNTFNAHRLIHWAAEFKQQTQLKLAFFDLYFMQAGDPSDDRQLLECVTKTGLDAAAAREVLASDRFKEEVRADQQWNFENGVSAVPFFIFDEKYSINGGQPKDVFMRILKKLPHLNEADKPGA